VGRLNLDLRFAYQAARLSLLSGDTTRAIALLDGALAALPTIHDSILRILGDAFAIPRILALRAEIDRSTDHVVAARLARGAVTLWSGADARYQPAVVRLRRIANSAPSR
jgi:hypothetical protein